MQKFTTSDDCTQCSIAPTGNDLLKGLQYIASCIDDCNAIIDTYRCFWRLFRPMVQYQPYIDAVSDIDSRKIWQTHILRILLNLLYYVVIITLPVIFALHTDVYQALSSIILVITLSVYFSFRVYTTLLTRVCIVLGSIIVGSCMVLVYLVLRTAKRVGTVENIAYAYHYTAIVLSIAGIIAIVVIIVWCGMVQRTITVEHALIAQENREIYARNMQIAEINKHIEATNANNMSYNALLLQNCEQQSMRLQQRIHDMETATRWFPRAYYQYDTVQYFLELLHTQGAATMFDMIQSLQSDQHHRPIVEDKDALRQMFEQSLTNNEARLRLFHEAHIIALGNVIRHMTSEAYHRG